MSAGVSGEGLLDSTKATATTPPVVSPTLDDTKMTTDKSSSSEISDEWVKLVREKDRRAPTRKAKRSSSGTKKASQQTPTNLTVAEDSVHLIFGVLFILFIGYCCGADLYYSEIVASLLVQAIAWGTAYLSVNFIYAPQATRKNLQETYDALKVEMNSWAQQVKAGYQRHQRSIWTSIFLFYIFAWVFTVSAKHWIEAIKRLISAHKESSDREFEYFMKTILKENRLRHISERKLAQERAAARRAYELSRPFAVRLYEEVIGK
ncbi:uncharacterized protein KY384_006202 [Bacidia gigantensis]|uniref:uncharacterized protein n=1 Tax=Bacidia gigantensis TaxID=2732470 RepID=UPI001D03D4FD|nr:uncharacterized protein KY384_006202 [Bacidia gigantensis]KAG8529565.1 hypothetical protein KY384_006202 [Bacidia gigantensis]